jgi:transcriptional regulator with XRE-family HTH domain
MQHAQNPVKEIREQLNLTQHQMADKMGCSHTSERRFEYDQTLPISPAVYNNLQRLARKADIELPPRPTKAKPQTEVGDTKRELATAA